MDSKKAQPDLENQPDLLEQGMPLEELFVQVEQCIAQLENPQISLEDAFRHYEEGIKKLRACNEKVDQIEKKMMFVNSQGELEDFD